MLQGAFLILLTDLGRSLLVYYNSTVLSRPFTTAINAVQKGNCSVTQRGYTTLIIVYTKLGETNIKTA